jgi:TolB-like protein
VPDAAGLSSAALVLLALSLVLASSPEAKLAAPGLIVSGFSDPVADPLTDHLARAFTNVQVITPRDIAALLGLERQKQLMGCNASECMAELGNALGVNGVLLGSVTRLGKVVQINAKIIEPADGRELASASERVNDEEEIFDALTRVGKQLRAQFLTALKLPTEETSLQPGVSLTRSGGTRRFFPIPMAIGGAALIGGVVLLVFSELSYQQLTTGAKGSLTFDGAAQIARNGNIYQLLGATFVTVGAAAVAAGFGLLLWGSRPESGYAAVGVAPNGVYVSGAF